MPGYKHELFPILGAAIARNCSVRIDNVPRTLELQTVVEMLEIWGAQVSVEGTTLALDPRSMVPDASHRLPEHVGSVRSALYLAMGMVARGDRIALQGVGGDRFGPIEGGPLRSFEGFTAVLERMGGRTVPCGPHHHGNRPQVFIGGPGRLRGAVIDILAEFSADPTTHRGGVNMHATKAALILGSVARGQSIVLNPLRWSSTHGLAVFLSHSGCDVNMVDDRWIVTPGPTPVDPVYHRLSPDPTALMTMVAAAVVLRQPLSVRDLPVERIEPFLRTGVETLRAMGVSTEWSTHSLFISPPARNDWLRPVDIEVNGATFDADATALYALMLLGAKGNSRITDHVFPHRTAYAQVLAQMGGQVHVDGNTVHLSGTKLRAPIQALHPSDSRCAAAAVLAGLTATPSTWIVDAGHLGRAYPDLPQSLRDTFGAQIEVLTTDPMSQTRLDAWSHAIASGSRPFHRDRRPV